MSARRGVTQIESHHHVRMSRRCLLRCRNTRGVCSCVDRELPFDDAAARGFVMNHMITTRAQLGVYLRLNDVPVPSTYGPSADEGQM